MTYQKHQEEIDTIEAHLAGTLQRINAPSGLFQRLYDRIQVPTPSEIKLRLKDWNRLLFIFSGVMSGMFILITLARAFYYLFWHKSTT